MTKKKYYSLDVRSSSILMLQDACSFFKFKFKDVLYSLRSKLKVDVSDVSSAAMFGNIQPLGEVL